MNTKTIKITSRQDIAKKTASRPCGDCTICCEGWLLGDIKGHKMYPGRPCFYSCSTGCSIYANRPYDPCQTFECLWKKSPEFIPEWMRPDQINAMALTKSINGIEYIFLIECGQKLDSSVLSWFFQQMAQGKFQNFKYNIDGGSNYIGTKEFFDAMESISAQG